LRSTSTAENATDEEYKSAAQVIAVSTSLSSRNDTGNTGLHYGIEPDLELDSTTLQGAFRSAVGNGETPGARVGGPSVFVLVSGMAVLGHAQSVPTQP